MSTLEEFSNFTGKIIKLPSIFLLSSLESCQFKDKGGMELNIKVHLEETGCKDGRQCGTDQYYQELSEALYGVINNDALDVVSDGSQYTCSSKYFVVA